MTPRRSESAIQEPSRRARPSDSLLEQRLDDGVLEREFTPLQFLLQWDDGGNDRELALDLFDTFGSKEKTLHANLGGHTGTPWFEWTPGPGSSPGI